MRTKVGTHDLKWRGTGVALPRFMEGMRQHCLKLLMATLVFLGGCYGEVSEKVTDDPKYVGSYRSGQTYTFKVDVDGVAKAGDKLRVGDAYLQSGINYSRVDIFGYVVDRLSRGTISIRGWSLTTGNQNLDGLRILGPDPKYLELVN